MSENLCQRESRGADSFECRGNAVDGRHRRFVVTAGNFIGVAAMVNGGSRRLLGNDDVCEKKLVREASFRTAGGVFRYVDRSSERLVGPDLPSAESRVAD
jgi:hypothetical protein